MIGFLKQLLGTSQSANSKEPELAAAMDEFRRGRRFVRLTTFDGPVLVRVDWITCIRPGRKNWEGGTVCDLMNGTLLKICEKPEIVIDRTLEAEA